MWKWAQSSHGPRQWEFQNGKMQTVDKEWRQQEMLSAVSCKRFVYNGSHDFSPHGKDFHKVNLRICKESCIF